MSKYFEFADKLNSIALAAFTRLDKADRALMAAEIDYKMHKQPVFTGIAMDATTAEKYRVEAETKEALIKAQDAHKIAMRSVENDLREIKEIRAELEETIDVDFSVKSENVDDGALKLLKSGIMKTEDYRQMYNQAAEQENITMMRLIGEHAGEAAAIEARANGESDKTRFLRLIEDDASRQTGVDILHSFDELTQTFKICANNPKMRASSWTAITGETLEEF